MSEEEIAKEVVACPDFATISAEIPAKDEAHAMELLQKRLKELASTDGPIFGFEILNAEVEEDSEGGVRICFFVNLVGEEHIRWIEFVSPLRGETAPFSAREIKEKYDVSELASKFISSFVR